MSRPMVRPDIHCPVRPLDRQLASGASCHRMRYLRKPLPNKSSGWRAVILAVGRRGQLEENGSQSARGVSFPGMPEWRQESRNSLWVPDFPCFLASVHTPPPAPPTSQCIRISSAKSLLSCRRAKSADPRMAHHRPRCRIFSGSSRIFLNPIADGLRTAWWKPTPPTPWHTTQTAA